MLGCVCVYVHFTVGEKILYIIVDQTIGFEMNVYSFLFFKQKILTRGKVRADYKT